jgi:hypothetical protein
MLITALVVAVGVFAAFVVVVVGVRGTDRRKDLCDPSRSGFADAFARRVLGVYIRQTTDQLYEHDQTTHCQMKR